VVADVAHLALGQRRMRPAFIGEPSLEWIIQPQIRPPTLSLAMSSPVKTWMSSRPSACEVSIRLMLACACGERTNTA
jgi:hypothetical protein